MTDTDTLYAKVEDVIPALKSDNSGVWADFNEPEKQLLDAVVAAASRQIDDYTNRRFWLDTTTSSRVFTPEDGSYTFFDDCAPTTMSVSVDNGLNGTYGTAWTAGTNYQLEPLNATAQGIAATGLRALSGYIMPLDYQDGSDVLVKGTNVYQFGGGSDYPPTSPAGRGRATIRITAYWGWPAVPAQIRYACILQCGMLLKSKDTPLGISGGADMGQMRLSSAIHPVARTLIDPFVRRSWIG
jgi:hypothetical protein